MTISDNHDGNGNLLGYIASMFRYVIKKTNLGKFMNHVIKWSAAILYVRADSIHTPVSL